MLKADVFDEDCHATLRREIVHTQLYDASVDVMGRHISGLLLVKTLDSGEKRIVFTNEAGLKFLDFGWDEFQNFHSYFVMKQLNRKAVIDLLRRDFELLIGFFYQYPAMGMHYARWTGWRSGTEYWMRTSFRKDVYYLVANADCSKLLRAETGSARKRMVTISYPDAQRVTINHHTFNMEINLKKIERQ